MSSHVHYLRDVPEGAILLDDLSVRIPDRVALIDTEQTLLSLGDYTRSQPTSPSPGRVYRKNLNWAPEHTDAWWIYVVAEAEGAPGFCDHHPFRAVIVDEPLRLLLSDGEGGWVQGPPAPMAFVR